MNTTSLNHVIRPSNEILLIPISSDAANKLRDLARRITGGIYSSDMIGDMVKEIDPCLEIKVNRGIVYVIKKMTANSAAQHLRRLYLDMAGMENAPMTINGETRSLRLDVIFKIIDAIEEMGDEVIECSHQFALIETYLFNRSGSVH
ncbi:MAG: hypothetical protein A3G02_00450 [Candidatus Yanofskybacteria bacterium RIFCSPLOWO2_12_FULL_44_13b]|uniref:Uncharacterized protein n=2 Tax=Candidatus Yanofskyibacteriota TaxID=1752733 RepID=A0A1F8GZU5_9BACT|nr:MAG: hypothetical protein UW14_C0004G0007 [Candidatus Yanofskybacteria bacterium GW2011_GWA2_44_10]KKT90321.1 MAG: hypothetical protein UW90_C0003G0045 [Candidatus Yanofskybacteria bacterium GW2011_GWB1_45_11]OGN14523.1 MAG: hypothetical protein A3C01_00345 [Candidatus Yanofskybacteria bacterium RIFCSPHIGHO2_02_FULL_44_36b]OGN18196.1 MAG: hypothetical protein A3F50_02400 [Candidatus Yanofskybacteria bacterium RIFCSPHIGHO2_12_FULL_44_29b]OGN30811.1 MAG: hypothetical protein A3I96_03190 [Candi